MNANYSKPAFPRPHSVSGDEHQWAQDGMTLRDYFAGQALAGLIHHYRSDEAVSPAPLEDLPAVAYQYADEMLKARER